MKDLLAELFGSAPEARLSALSSSDNELEILRERNQRIEIRYERLKLVTLAMWELLKRAENLNDGDLREMITHLDMADGRRDGKVSVREGIGDCEACGRIVLQSSPRCPYCGAANESYDPLTAV